MIIADQEAPIVIHADKAWEGEDGTSVFFEGNFEMQTTQWRVIGERSMAGVGLDVGFVYHVESEFVAEIE